MISREPHRTNCKPAQDASSSVFGPTQRKASAAASAASTSLQGDLRQIKAQVAEEFLALTASLQSISGQAREIAARSRQETTVAAADQAERAINELERLLADADQVRSLSDNSRTLLRAILDHLQRCHVPLAHLVSLPFLLNTVGMLSRIEASRIGNTSEEVCSLAGDIGALSGQIERQVNSIMAEAERLPPMITDSLKRLEDVHTRQQQQAEDLMGHTQSVLGPMHARAEASRAAAHNIEEQYAGIRAATDKIVMSLQCEDIARQRIEHVVEGLSQAAALESSGDLQACAGIVALQHSQLQGTRDLLSNSLQSFLASARVLSSHLEQLIADTAAFANQTDEDGHSVALVMENGLRTVSSIYDQYAASAQAIISTVEALLPSVSGMTKGANELKKIAGSIRRTALNARIETSHLGEEGATLRALAAEVQHVTEGSEDETLAVLEHLSAIDEKLAAVSARCESSGGATLLSTNFRQELASLIDSVDTSSRQMSAGLRDLMEKSGALGAELRNTCAVAERAAQITQSFDAALQQLEQVSEGFGAPDMAFASDTAAKTANLEKMYSMQSERDIHRQLFGGADQPQAGHDSSGDVELF